MDILRTLDKYESYVMNGFFNRVGVMGTDSFNCGGRGDSVAKSHGNP